MGSGGASAIIIADGSIISATGAVMAISAI